MKFMVKLFLENEKGELYNPCGTSHTFIIRDLKTLRGVKNRIKKYPINKNTKEIRIYSWDGSLTNEISGLTLLDTITL